MRKKFVSIFSTALILAYLCLCEACTQELIYNPEGGTSQPDNTATTDSVCVKLATAGSLEAYLKDSCKLEPLNVLALKVVGAINGNDLRLLRSMAGAGLTQDEKTAGQLVRLDLSEASFAGGGAAHFVYEGEDGAEPCILALDNVVPRYAFGYTRLREVKLPEGITALESQAFYHCDSLCMTNIPSTVRTVGRSAFCYCHDLASPMTIPEGIEELGDYTFYDCSSLPSLELPASLERIGYQCFANCQTLASLGKKRLNVATLGSYAFYKCASLRQMVVPRSGVLPEGAYHSCSSLNSPNLTGIREVGKYAFERAILKAPQLAEGIVTIGDSAFCNASIEGDIVLPKSLRYVGAGAFASNSITSISLQSDIHTNHNGRAAFFSNKKLASLTVAEGVGVLDLEFSSCPVLNKVSLPSTLDSIGTAYYFYDAKGNAFVSTYGSIFYNCTGLSDIRLPKGLRFIGASSFANCTALERVELPDGVSLLGPYVFNGCTALTSIKLPSSLTSVSQGLCQGCTSLQELSPPSSVTEIEYAAFKGSGLKSIQLPEGVCKIGPMAFQDCTALTAIRLPAALHSIGHDAFSGCTSLTEADMPAECQLDSIGASAFYKCSALRSVALPAMVSMIGEYAFSTCGLETVSLPASLVNMGEGAFAYCGRLRLVHNWAITPQDITSGMFVGIQLGEATLCVPATAIETYRLHPIWGLFGTTSYLPDFSNSHSI